MRPVTTPRWTRAELARVRGELERRPAYRNYVNVRDKVLQMNELGAGTSAAEPSAYWREELSMFEYMLDASPFVIENLRHHTHFLTGLRAYDYRSNRESFRQRMEEKLRALLKRGGELQPVPESPELGGFGFDIDGALYNVDTLKYFEVLQALKQGAVLDEFQSRERRLVWEIGAGWGGFAYQFKTLCPNTTYVITDFPELFLFSATYLTTLFPQARVLFYGDVPDSELFSRWSEYDFILLPNGSLSDMRPPRLDLAINMVSFQEMTSEQVRAYVTKAFELECPFLYSLNRDRSAYNLELTSVRDIITEYYWPHEISILPVSYQKMLDEPPSDKDYRHVIGWRKVQPQ